MDGGRARLITALDVTPGEVADEHLLDRLLKEHRGTTGRTVAEVVADTKYGTCANYVALEQQGIRASIPPHSTMSDRGDYSADRFVYEFAADRYRCPTGQLLTRQGSSRTAGAAGGLIYRGRPKVCGACPVKAQCCDPAARPHPRAPGRWGTARPGRRYLRTPPAKRSRRAPRAYWVETANAELKDRHGLRRAQCRGRDKVLIQALGAIAYDVKKLAQRRAPSPAMGWARWAPPPFSSGPVPVRARSGGGRSRRVHGARVPRTVLLLTTIPDFGNRPWGTCKVRPRSGKPDSLATTRWKHLVGHVAVDWR